MVQTVSRSFGKKDYHIKEARHLKRLRGMESDLNLVKKVMWRYVTLFTNPVQQEVTAFLDQVRHPPWRQAVQAGLYHYLFDPSNSSCDEDKERQLLDESLCKIRRYMHQERLVLLRLAAWKAQCLGQMPGNLDYLSSAQWASVDWKMCKVEQRECNAIGVIVGAIRPFLDHISQDPIQAPILDTL
jgi:hypothetical protein